MSILQVPLPADLEGPLQQKAAAAHLSVTDLVVAALRDLVREAPLDRPKRDFSDIFDGTPLEPEVLEILESQRQIDPDVWK